MKRFRRFVRYGATLVVLFGLASSGGSPGTADSAKSEKLPSPGSDAKAVPSSQQFQGIWYRTPEKRGVFAVFLASGDLTVGADTISFESKKIQLTIPTAGIIRLVPADFPDDPVHTWILVEYEEGDSIKAAAFKDGRMIGGDTQAVHEALESALSASAALSIAALHTSRVESLYYTNETVPRNVWKLVSAPGLEDELIQAYTSGDQDDLFRYNIIMILSRRAAKVEDEGTRQRIRNCMMEALAKDSFGWVKVEALDALARLGDEKEALAQAEVLMRSGKYAEIHQDVAKWIKGVTTASSRDLVMEVCTEVETKKFEGKGQKEKSKTMAQLVCRVAANVCAEKPEEDACKNTLRDLDAHLQGSGSSMLFETAYRGLSDLVKTMISLGSDVNAAKTDGWTALMLAAAEGHGATVAILMNAGAHPNAKNSLGRTPLMFASSYGFTDIVKDLLARGADPNVVPTDTEGRTALMAAAVAGHVETVQVLLSDGADAALTDKGGKTAFALAEAEGHSDVASILKGHGQAQ